VGLKTSLSRSIAVFIAGLADAGVPSLAQVLGRGVFNTLSACIPVGTGQPAQLAARKQRDGSASRFMIVYGLMLLIWP